MSRLFVIIICLLFSAGCKKTVEKIQANIIVEAMTTGRWKMVSFTQNNNSRTAEFASFTFQFHKNNRVDAMTGTTVAYSGDWEGFPDSRTIWSSFPGSPAPINLLDGTWKIDKNSWTYVEASQVIGSEQKKLRLEKI